MIVIGADTHKGSHALAAVDEGTGRIRGSREIKADEPGHLAAVRWARGLDEERVWALEDCRHVSRRLEQALLAAGERVVRVPPQRMGASRKGEREPGNPIRSTRWRSLARSSRTASSSSRSRI
jgi:transposase